MVTKENHNSMQSTMEGLCRWRKGGMTPLISRTKEMYNSFTDRNKKYLSILFVDGEPNEPIYGSGQKAFDILVDEFDRRQDNIFTMIVMCTDNSAEVEKYNGLDERFPRFDICDDFFSERIEIANVYKFFGKAFDERRFPYEDYLIKIMIGCVDPDIDGLDEGIPKKKK